MLALSGILVAPSAVLSLCQEWGASMRRGVAQPGRALPSGGRGRRFKSCHPDLFLQVFCSLVAPRQWGNRVVIPTGPFLSRKLIIHIAISAFFC